MSIVSFRSTWTKRGDLTDKEYVEQLQLRNRNVEERFYHSMKRYFDNSFNKVFFDKDKKQEIFQSAFVKLWTEIDNGRISVKDEQVQRQQNDGLYKPMTCSLSTFMMAFARTEYRELLRKDERETPVAEFFDESFGMHDLPVTSNVEEDEEQMKNRIVDECIQQMSPTCVEILTLFYYEGKSLDDIMVIRQEKTSSKNGLKTAKNKCMNTLKERVAQQFEKYHLTA